MKKFFLTAIMCFATFATFAQTSSRFQLIELPYPSNALEPTISQQTIELHHGKHLKGYVDNLNKLIMNTEFENAPIEKIVATAPQGSIFNNAGQLLNHNYYFTQFSPKAEKEPKGELAKAIIAKWESIDNFKKKFVEAGSKIFGSGWVWLAKDSHGDLSIKTYSNAGNPVVDGLQPLLGFDVWEHAYYIDYQNRRADHLNALWNIVDWKIIGERYNAQ